MINLTEDIKKQIKKTRNKIVSQASRIHGEVQNPAIVEELKKVGIQ